jgi:hypothetical protein
MLTAHEALNYSRRMDKAMARGMTMDAALPADKDERLAVLAVRRVAVDADSLASDYYMRDGKLIKKEW